VTTQLVASRVVVSSTAFIQLENTFWKLGLFPSDEERRIPTLLGPIERGNINFYSHVKTEKVEITKIFISI
jgi:hypothetical protein